MKRREEIIKEKMQLAGEGNKRETVSVRLKRAAVCFVVNEEER